jgi:Icc-related predicted phosphoesterase
MLRRSILLLTAGSCLTLVGCKEKKVETPPVAPKIEVKPAPVVAPVVVAEVRAPKECAASIDPGPVTELKLGTKTATLNGARLTFAEKDADGALKFGVLGPINEDSGANMLAMKKYVKFFVDEKVDAIVVTGDIGEAAPEGITRVLTELGQAKLPILAIIGNRECRGAFTDGVNAAKEAGVPVVNLNQVRVVEYPELKLVTLPGHFDANFIACSTGCQYVKSTIDEIAKEAKASTIPVALIAHGPPRGKGATALDFAQSANVGDEEITKLINENNISFGFFSNIKEAGARASKDADGTQMSKEGETSKTLFLNPGPADTYEWQLNDGSKSNGLAAVVTIKDGLGSFKLLRLKAPSAAEKAEAKKLDPKVAPAATP